MSITSVSAYGSAARFISESISTLYVSGATVESRLTVARYAPAALVAALLVATGLAFAYTEQLKLTRSPIIKTRVLPKVFSPTCSCATDRVRISFVLRERDRVSVEMVDAGGETVRTLVRRRAAPPGRLNLTWNGRDDAGQVVPEGRYRPEVRLARERRTIVLPNPIRVDTTPPVVELVSARPRVFSPDGDGRKDRVMVRYRADGPARVALYVDGTRRVQKRGQQEEGRVDWNGRVDGEPLPSGVYTLDVRAEDEAGNASQPSRRADVVIRYVALGRDRIETRPGARFSVLVLSDAVRVEWRLGAKSGTARPGTLRLRAPLQPGRFTLVVSANGFDARAAVLVRRPAEP